MLKGAIKKKGLTLVETLLVVMISALVMAAIVPFIRSVASSWQAGSGKQEILQNGRTALEMMTRYIRQAKRITGIPGPSGNYIKIRDPEDTYTIIFYHNVVVGSPYYIAPTTDIKDNDLVMRSNQSGSDINTMLAPAVTSLNFNFLRDDRSPAQKANQVRTIDIEMELADPLNNIPDRISLENMVVFRPDIKISASLWVIDGRVTNNVLRNITEDIEVTGFNVGINSGDCLAVNPSDGSCWIADTNNNRIKKVDSNGAVIFTSSTSGYSRPNATSVNSSTGECWVANTSSNNIRKLRSDGVVIFTTSTSGYSRPRSVSVNSSTGECWVANTNRNNIRKLQANGTIIFTTSNIFSSPRSVSVNTTTGECWVADTGNNRVVKLSSSGSVLWSSAAGVFSSPYSVSVNPTNNSCWVADFGNDRIVRLNADGDEEFNIDDIDGPVAISTNAD
ncbi:MAG: hypothetical protein A2166_06500 [Omnitrophica WOR_2 bacterium RBG_13_41_10]|nr:MAG: hypothetical protein A2166_06500 [Omnitrophica WOR_2 bacterium RBG_13_41_10]